MSVPHAPSSDFWNRLDGIAVINLDDRPDRWDEIRANAAVFLKNAPPLTRISAIRGIHLPGYGKRPWFRGKSSDKRWAARGGCTQSHRKAIEHARKQGWATFLVLEDDADFHLLAGVNLTALEHALFTKHADWDVCYLGFSKARGTSLELIMVGEHRLCEMVGCDAAHAYIVRTPARDWILDRLAYDSSAWAWLARNRSIDRWYSRALSRELDIFAISPSVVIQAPSYSDIVQREVNYDEEFSGRIEHITRDTRQFARDKALHHALLSLSDLHDAFRGLIKRIGGF